MVLSSQFSRAAAWSVRNNLTCCPAAATPGCQLLMFSPLQGK
jgi:hypothetical protein